MKDLLSILREAPGSIRLEVSGEDLLAFSSNLINRAKEYAMQRSGIGTGKGI